MNAQDDGDQEKQRSLLTQQNVAWAKEERARQMRRAMTPAEEILWEYLRAGRLGVHFRRQQIIDGFIADFYCHRARLVVEVDGAAHYGDEPKAYDAQRDLIFQQRGLTVLRISNAEVMSRISATLDRIRQALNTSH